MVRSKISNWPVPRAFARYMAMSALRQRYSGCSTAVELITIPMLVMFLFFNRRIVEGMTAGAVKG